ncbi:hypothetical protein FRB97_005579 [Tulasnella sp. 331]|nr:hypothetical protein FRB97_005579 [Tulasnella sp. 331]
MADADNSITVEDDIDSTIERLATAGSEGSQEDECEDVPKFLDLNPVPSNNTATQDGDIDTEGKYGNERVDEERMLEGRLRVIVTVVV